MKHHIIYVPGFGDDRARFQIYAIQLWRLFGVIPHYLPVGWSRNQGYETKEQLLSSLVDELQSAGRSVSLVGVSAGASICMNVFASSGQVSRLIVISGKFMGSGGGGDFGESLRRSTAALASLDKQQRARILSIHPQFDPVVPVPETKIPGAVEKTVPGMNHAVGIFFGLIFGAPAIGRFARKKN